MRNLLFKTLACSGLLLLGLTASAQQYPQYPRGDYYRYQENRGGNQFLERLRSDLDRAEANAFPFSGDRYRISRAREELNEFENAWQSGTYDARELNDLIATVQRVVNSNRMPERDRDLLIGDLNQMRDFRARRNEWR